MRQFAGHWYSGRAARLCAVEAALVGLALWVTGRHAVGNLRALAALIGAAACVPAALYLADLYDPQVMRNDRARGSGTLKALGFAALFAAIIGVLGGGGMPKGALIGTFGVASLGVLLARAALVTRTDEDAHSRVLILGAGSRAAEIARLIRTHAFGEYQVAGTLDPKLDLGSAAENDDVVRAVAGVEPAQAQPLLTLQAEPLPAEVALAPVPAVVPGAQLIVAASSASVEASVAALPAQARAEGSESGPLAPVVQLPGAPAHSLQIAARTLPDAVRQLRVDTVVIAVDEAQEALPVDELIRLRLGGVTVLPAHRFAERVLRRASPRPCRRPPSACSTCS